MIPILKNIPNVEEFEPTLLEISGYLQYENIISDILAFYIDFNNNHGLGDLIFKSLYQLIVNDGNYKLPTFISVEREVYVGDGRIDILIITDELVIGIENKVKDKKGKNPLGEYEKYIKNILIKKDEKREKNRYGVLLSVWKKKPSVEFFENLLYQNLFKKITENDVQKALKSENLYVKFLLELITTIERLKNQNGMTEKEMNYLVENKTDIIKLNKLVSKYFVDIRSKLSELRENLDIEKYVKSSKLWIDKEIKDKLNGVALYNLTAIDNIEFLELKVRLGPEGWSIEIWKTKDLSGDKKNILSQMSESNFIIKDKKEYIIISEKSYSTKIPILKKSIESILKKLYEVE